MSESVSDIVTTAAPALLGVWVFDPLDPDGTERNYLHAQGTAEELNVSPVEIPLVGKENPLVEYGETTLVGVKLTMLVPFGPTHDDLVDAWRTMARDRRAICYRDGRGRLLFSAINDRVGIVDGRVGTALAVSLRRVDFDEVI